jgi:hypothetical protein
MFPALQLLCLLELSDVCLLTGQSAAHHTGEPFCHAWHVGGRTWLFGDFAVASERRRIQPFFAGTAALPR